MPEHSSARSAGEAQWPEHIRYFMSAGRFGWVAYACCGEHLLGLRRDGDGRAGV